MVSDLEGLIGPDPKLTEDCEKTTTASEGLRSGLFNCYDAPNPILLYGAAQGYNYSVGY